MTPYSSRSSRGSDIPGWRSSHVPLFIAVALLSAAAATSHAADAPGPALLMTADGEGHVQACATCPMHRGLGGLERRVTALAGARTPSRPALLVDAGNWLVGGESLDSRGEVIVAAYNALQYDAVNLTTKDLYWGKDGTLDLVKKAKFATVSANLLDEQSGKPLVAPYLVKQVGGVKVGIVGVCEPPAALAALPHLQKQLQGIKIRPPAEALDEWLPKTRAESDRLVVLYHGSGRGLRAVREKLAGSGAVLLAGGVRPENVAPGGDVPLVAAEEHGKSIARATLGAQGVEVTQVMVTPDLPADEAMAKLVASYAPKPLTTDATGTQPPVKQEPPVVADATKPKDGRTEMPTDPKPKEPDASKPPVVADATTEKPPVTTPPQKEPPKRVAAKQTQEPKGLAGVGLTAEQVNASIDRGAEFLWKYVKAERDKSHDRLGANKEYDLLVALALVKAGAHKKFPDFDEQLRAYLPKVYPTDIDVYGCGVLCMLIEAYGDSEFYPQLLLTSRYLLEGQSKEGSWDYRPKVPPDALQDPRSLKALQVWGGRPTDGSPAEQWRRTTEPDKHEGGDNSVTQYALLGLHAASRAGVEIPRDTWQRALDMYRSRQDPDSGSWGYVGPASSHTGSMTCAGLYAVDLCRFHLGEKTPAQDESVERGLAWLNNNFTVAGNPLADTSWHYYYLYALERAGRTLDTEFVGPHEWYPLGAQFLVGAQKEDGSWIEPGPYVTRPDVSTSFALLFLTRGTSTLTAARPTGGKGLLKTAAVEPAAPRVYFIFDCSGSMLAEIGGQSKFDEARAALDAIVADLPPQTQVALRVYGHRKSAREPGADEDTELLVPMGKLDRADLSSRVRKLRARGKTPLARSITEAAKDLAGSSTDNPCTVILITDGGEDTRPPLDPVAAARDLRKLAGVTLHVVGFDIGRDDWGRQLRATAQAGGGRYWPSGDANALRAELRAAVLRAPETFTINDSAGRRVLDGKFGKPVTLPEGRYTLATTFAGKRFEEALWVNTAATTAVLFDAGKIDVTPPSPGGMTGGATAGGQEPAQSPGGAARPKFCTSCGKPLAAGAKFCTNCGAKVAQ